MGEKDVAEKTLEAYNDVFADIVNTLIFGGERRISADDLEDGAPFSQYKADGGLHEQERDVAKYWKKDLLRLAFFGFENQSAQDEDMALRVIGYDGAAYRAQMLADERVAEDGKTRTIKKPRYPVFTFVLYFGTKRRWTGPRSLGERLELPVPTEMEPYFHDYGVNLFEIAWLSDEQVSMFQSDFRIVADYFVQLRKNQDYVPPEGTIRHVHELLQLLSVLRGDRRFEEAYQETMEEEDTTMCEMLDRMIAKGQAKGEAIGEARGQAKGEAIGEARGQAKGEVKMLASLVKKGTFTIRQAAEELSLTEEAFLAKCEEYSFTL